MSQRAKKYIYFLKIWWCLWSIQACKGGARRPRSDVQSSRHWNGPTDAQRKHWTNIVYTCVCMCVCSRACGLSRMSTNIKIPAFFFFLNATFDTESTVVSSRLNVGNKQLRRKKRNDSIKTKGKKFLSRGVGCFCGRKKRERQEFTIFQLKATNVSEVHCLWERLFIKRWSASIFFLLSLSWRSPSWDRALWAEKKFCSFSLEFVCFSLQGGVGEKWVHFFSGRREEGESRGGDATRHFQSPAASGTNRFSLGMIAFTLVCVCVCVCVMEKGRESVSVCVCVSAVVGWGSERVSACAGGRAARVIHGAVVMAFRSFIRPSRWAISSVSSSGS